MAKWYFSFGSSHHDTRGRTLDGWYTMIEAPTETGARLIYIERYGHKWSGNYDQEQIERCIARYGWQYISFEALDLCSQVPQEDVVADARKAEAGIG